MDVQGTAALAVSRMETPEELAATVLFLASDTCSWFTGQIVYHNGGDMMLG